ncbi:MAG: DUF4019 domain-containing protein [Verrucomicrobia bacterium]|nr:DUF4019 domain-containing protein [Verrucomicrobiota bacterium]MBS0647252.1 DUF4019 domain-containing protein [Verrucomicrobiota bacterium]
MISILFTFPLLFGWLTDAMIYQQQQQENQANEVKTPPGEQKLPVNPPPASVDRRANLANEPGKTERAIRTDNANQQVMYWLSLNDQKQYRASWLGASSFLQDVISQDQWAAAMDSVRSGLGPAKSRQMISQKKVTQLPHGTRGHFVEISYQTQFAKGGNMTEIITLMLENRSEDWKVVSYKIQK